MNAMRELGGMHDGLRGCELRIDVVNLHLIQLPDAQRADVE